MKKRLKILFILTLLVLSGCVYFNTYFNAKESYREAERKRLQNNTIDRNLYQNSIKELSKILEFYPESRWVDDALMMMGLCFMRLEEHSQARIKFIELITNFPESKYLNEAKLKLAETEIALNNPEEAKKLIIEIGEDEKVQGSYELIKLNAYLNLATGDSISALDSYIKASEQKAPTTEKAVLYEKIADLAIALGRYEISSDYYEKVISLETERKRKFDLTVKYSESLKNSGKYEQAIGVLEKITDDPDYYEHALKGLVKLSSYLLLSGREQRARDEINSILQTYKKDRLNGALLSEAAFYSGEIYFNIDKDFERARAMYDSSGFYDRRNPFFQKAAERIRVLNDVEDLKKKIEENKTRISEIDSGNEPSDIRENVVTLRKDLADKLFFEMNLTDSAKAIYRDIAYEREFPHTASLAMLRVFLADSIRHHDLKDSIISLYPYTESANYIRSLRNIEPVTVITDSAKYFFDMASQKFLDSLYSEAVEEYTNIALRFNKSPKAPFILQAAGMIAENKLADYERAAELFSLLKEKFPTTEEGRYASRKLREDGAAVSKEEEEPVKKQDVTGSELWYLMDRRND